MIPEYQQPQKEGRYPALTTPKLGKSGKGIVCNLRPGRGYLREKG
jgi:hypothetical protein